MRILKIMILIIIALFTLITPVRQFAIGDYIGTKADI